MPPFIHIIALCAFLANSFGPLPSVQAQELRLPQPGLMVSLSSPLNPPMLKGLKIDPNNPLKFDFILDQGDTSNVIPAKAGIHNQEQLKIESNKLIKYFLASITIPENDLWVNLSPYEKNRIVPHSFGQTEMGRDLLAEDYMLKQITASLIYPEGETGRKFWQKVYQEAYKRYGTTNVPINTFNKVWIVPQKAVVYENVKAGTAYVVESKLKVMLEEDYLSMQKHNNTVILSKAKDLNKLKDSSVAPQNDKNVRYDVASIGANILREIVIPELTKEVNEDKNFAQLRQVYNSLILATWYKKKIKDSILEQVYADKKKIVGVGYNNSVILSETKDLNKSKDSSAAPQNDVDKIYQRYLKAFKKGVFNYIKAESDPQTQENIPRKYFSGGTSFAQLSVQMTKTEHMDAAQLNNPQGLFTVSGRFDAAMTGNNLDSIRKNVARLKKRASGSNNPGVLEGVRLELRQQIKKLDHEAYQPYAEFVSGLRHYRAEVLDKRTEVYEEIGEIGKKLRNLAMTTQASSAVKVTDHAMNVQAILEKLPSLNVQDAYIEAAALQAPYYKGNWVNLFNELMDNIINPVGLEKDNSNIETLRFRARYASVYILSQNIRHFVKSTRINDKRIAKELITLVNERLNIPENGEETLRRILVSLASYDLSPYVFANARYILDIAQKTDDAMTVEKVATAFIETLNPAGVYNLAAFLNPKMEYPVVLNNQQSIKPDVYEGQIIFGQMRKFIKSKRIDAEFSKTVEILIKDKVKVLAEAMLPKKSDSVPKPAKASGQKSSFKQINERIEPNALGQCKPDAEPRVNAQLLWGRLKKIGLDNKTIFKLLIDYDRKIYSKSSHNYKAVNQGIRTFLMRKGKLEDKDEFERKVIYETLTFVSISLGLDKRRPLLSKTRGGNKYNQAMTTMLEPMAGGDFAMGAAEGLVNILNGKMITRRETRSFFGPGYRKKQYFYRATRAKHGVMFKDGSEAKEIVKDNAGDGQITLGDALAKTPTGQALINAGFNDLDLLDIHGGMETRGLMALDKILVSGTAHLDLEHHANFIPHIYFFVAHKTDQQIGSQQTGNMAMKAGHSKASGPGGIDFTANRVPLQIKMDSRFRGNDRLEGGNDDGSIGIRFHLDPAMIERLKNAQGFVPVITGFKPLTDLRAFLGIVNQVQ